MKTYLITTLLLLTILNNVYAQATKEIMLENVFIIKEGYDSNDEIELTLYGSLPSPCYKVDKINITPSQNNTHFSITVLMKKKRLRGCEQTIYKAPVNFSKVLSLGELPAGKYTFTYNTKGGEKTDSMIISVAQSDSIDESLYAPISNAFIPELIYQGENAVVVLTGIFHTNCLNLNSADIEVIKKDNIFIILPKSKLTSIQNCNDKKYPIREIVNLGSITKKGNYLIHIRSLNGGSVNQVFQVESSDFNGSGM